MESFATFGRRINAPVVSVAIAAMLAGCAEKRDPSLVGDWLAPKPELLMKQTIEVQREVGPVGKGVRRVTYLVRPGGSVHFEQTVDDGAPMSPATYRKTEAQTDFRLSDRQYRKVLEQLALLHPRSLPGEVQPKGCDHVYDAGLKAGAFFVLSSKQIGMFSFQHTCTGHGAVGVEKLLVDLFDRLGKNHRNATSASGE